ncbi:uncharacterized protein LOC119168104 [Rhipicephalus microplus]|uniref:uncharacterized protein LOC119168104 n=1 Tax=Rhipicephalus microplus TaxID=6941 RepID=UPI003F6C385D
MAALALAVVLSVFAFLEVSHAEPATLRADGPDSGLRGSDSAWRGPWSPNKRCLRPNEVFKKCVSSSCAEMKCGMRNAPFICTADCQSGCFCRDGYYRNRWGQCVTAWQCKAYYPWNPWNPWTPWNPYYPGFTTRPTTYPGIYGPEVYGFGGSPWL